MTSFDYQAGLAVYKSGGVIAYPTESCYGLGCDPDNQEAVQRILEIKGRSSNNGLILIANTVVKLKPYIVWPTGLEQQAILDSWPGPTTWLIKASAKTPRYLTGHHLSLAVRIPDHPGVMTFCQTLNKPLVSTSANPHGQVAAKTADEVYGYFGEKIDVILAGQIGTATTPSKIIDAATGRVIR